LIVWRRAIQFRGQSRVSTWLFGIARRQAHKTWVAHLRTPPSALSADATESDAPEVSLDRQERERSVARALAMLPRHERQVIEFAYYHAYTSQDIAAHLGCSVDTVKTHLSRARRHLAIQLTRRDQRSRTVLLSASPTAQTLWHDSGKRCGQRQPQSHA
jgi:RNA polymerase sigma-70 factor (ECF subfamily)